MVTLGMSYRVVPGREEKFERVFDAVVDQLAAVEGHVRTRLFRACDGASPEEGAEYLIQSEWRDRRSFDAFLDSSVFARVTAWGGREILRDRPEHAIYERKERVGDRANERVDCPVAHAS